MNAAGAAVGRDAAGRSRLRSFLVWLLFHRFQLLLAVGFVVFPWFARGPGASLFANLFVLGAGAQAAVAALAVALGQVLVIATWTSTRAGPLRLWPGLGDEPPERAIRLGYREFRHAFRRSWGTSRRWARRMPALLPWLALGLAAPTLVTVHRASAGEATSAARSALALLAGVLVAQAVLLAAALATAWLTPAGARHGLLEGSPLARRVAAFARRRTLPGAAWLRARFTSWLARGPFGPGYVWVDPAGRRILHSGHLAALGLALATLAVYVALGVVNRPGAGEVASGRLPALGALLLVLTMAAWIFPALSFLLDRFRAPVVPALLLLSLALYAASEADHYFALRAPEEALPSPGEDWALVDSWFEPGADGVRRPIVAVAAAGGGITASAWTATVLCGLASGEGGAEFLASLKLISGVSGGAVGAMFFLDRLPPQPMATMRPMNGATVAAIRQAASASSLEAVGWALAYPDLLRTVASWPFARLWPELDRSWALEASWRRRLTTAPRRATLSAWRHQALAGEKPLVLFGATAVETGARLELANLALAEPPPARDFWSLYPGWDLDVVTAARLSAAFPFVSLASRARAPEGEDGVRPAVAQSHLVDGGYADNAGVLAAIELLGRALARRCGDAASCDAPPIVLLRVRAFVDEGGDPATARRADPWLTSAASPLFTLMSVRTASQVERNEFELALFASKWNRRGVGVSVVDFDLGGAGPLSWKLTAAERELLWERWSAGRSSAGARQRLVEALRPPTP